jgi:hypothetical protein
MFKPHPLDTPARLARFVGSSYPGVVPRSTLAGALEVAESMPDEDRLDVMTSLLDWYVGTSPARIGMMIDQDPAAITLAVRRGRRALSRSGRRPDGSPMVAGSPCRP